MAHHLVQHIRGDWRRRPPMAERAAAIGEREQRACCEVYPCPWCGERYDDGYCIASADDTCSTPGCPDCGGPVEAVACVEPLTASIAERLAA